MKHKCPAELNSRIVRINVGTYQLLRELSRIRGITIAEALDLAITDRVRQEAVTVTPRTQMPMPLTTAYRVTAPVAIRVRLQPTIATNGSKAAAFRIKPKGVRHA